MKPGRLRATALAGVVVATICVTIASAATGVKTMRPPQLVPTAPGVVVDPILSTSDVVPNGQMPPYQMSGIPDGLGAYSNRGPVATTMMGEGGNSGRAPSRC